MMTEYLTYCYYHMTFAVSILATLVSLPIFLYASILVHRTLKTTASALLVVAVAAALLAKLLRLTPLALTRHDGGYSATIVGVAAQMFFRVDMLVIAVLALLVALAMTKKTKA
jgi:hypothetical protein